MGLESRLVAAYREGPRQGRQCEVGAVAGYKAVGKRMGGSREPED